MRSSGIPYNIFRCSYVLGPGDELTPYLVAGLNSGSVGIPGDGLYRIQPIWIEDLAEILLRACDLGTASEETIDLLGESVSLIEFCRRLAREIAPSATISNRAVADFLREALRSDEPDFTTGELALLMYDATGPCSGSCCRKPTRSSRIPR